ncbi:MAG: hypothetical protein HYV02_08760 [Deltaproteobacteria bacterium]|nr:hypothetical protein [Deltaproteobacteria bacterium]
MTFFLPHPALAAWYNVLQSSDSVPSYWKDLPYCYDPDGMLLDDTAVATTITYNVKHPDGTVTSEHGNDFCKNSPVIGDCEKLQPSILEEYTCNDYVFAENFAKAMHYTVYCPKETMCLNGACVKMDDQCHPIGGDRGREGPGGETPSTTLFCEGNCGSPGCPLCDVETGNCTFVDGKDTGNDIYLPGTIQFTQEKGDLTMTEADACSDDLWLKEYGCTADGKKLQDKIKCDKGCNIATGACIKGECIDEDAGAGSISVEVLWEEFSFDYKYATPSKAYLQDSSGAALNAKTDYCVDANGQKVEKGIGVVESYCQDKNIPIFEGEENGGPPSYYTCPKEVEMFGYSEPLFDGCCKGACYVEKLYCKDSDGGVDLNKAGGVVKGNGCGVPPDVKTDTCGVARYKAKGPGLDFKKSGEYGDSVLEYSCENGQIAESWNLCQGKNNGCHKGACVDLSDKVCQSEILKSGNPALAAIDDLFALVNNGKVAKGFEISSNGVVSEVTRYQSCNDTTDYLTTYFCADEVQSGKPGELAKPWFYVVGKKKTCSMGCPTKADLCPECVEDVEEWPNLYKNTMCGVW